MGYPPPSARMRQLKDKMRRDRAADAALAAEKPPFPEYTSKTRKADLLVIAKSMSLDELSDDNTKVEILAELDAAKAAY